MNCYVNNPYSGAPTPEGVNKDNTLFYPESKMTTDDCHRTARPEEYHIVTDNHMLVALYDREEVFIYRKGKWINPDFQTYGASYNLILMELWNITSTIPKAVLDGKTTNCMGQNKKQKS